MNTNENATFNQSNVEMSNPPTNITFTVEQLAEAGTHYYAYYDDSYTVTWIGVMPSVITAPGYVEITEDQYNNGNLMGKVYDPETGNFNDPWIFSCCTYEVQYKQTEDNVQTILDDMQADITALQTAGGHTHDNKTVLDGITADKITSWDNAASGSGTAAEDGEDGATFTPSVSTDGVLSWTNDKGLTNPASVNIKGADGTTVVVGTTTTGNAGTDASVTSTLDSATNTMTLNFTIPRGADGVSGSDIAAADILTKIKTVDGQNSGLDADTLDGLEASAFATTSQLAGKADSDHTHSGYAVSDHTHTGYATTGHTHSDYVTATTYANGMSGKADTNHTHSSYASSSHTHSGYASSSHTHSDYLSTSGGTVSGTLYCSSTSSALDVMGEANFRSVVRTLGTQTLYNSGSGITLSSNNTTTYIAGSSIYSSKTISVSSDERLKENIENVETDKMIDFINGIDVKSFNYTGNDEKCIGAIAQQVQEIDPEIAKYFVTEGEDGYLSIKIADLVYPLITAVQKLTREVKELKGDKE